MEPRSPITSAIFHGEYYRLSTSIEETYVKISKLSKPYIRWFLFDDQVVDHNTVRRYMYLHTKLKLRLRCNAEIMDRLTNVCKVSLDDACSHIVGLGRKQVHAVMADPWMITSYFENNTYVSYHDQILEYMALFTEDA